MDLKKLTVKEFDKAAEHFEDSTPSVYNLCKKDYPDILAEINKEKWQSVLDAGCGTGAVLELLSRKYPEKEYTGIDISKKMIEFANKKGLANVRFVNGDCENLPFEDKSFDCVICSQSFHHYTDPQSFFNSVSRVLKREGRLILRDMSTNITPIYWFVNHIELPLINLLAHKGDVRIYSEKDIQKLCHNCGMKMERFEHKWFFRMHVVCRKK